MYFFFVIGNVFLVFAQEDFCNQNLMNPDDPLGYKLRTDCCEGKYVQDVDSTILRMVSLTESFEDYDLNSNRELTVEWAVPKAQRVNLRAQRLQPPFYYRIWIQFVLQATQRIVGR